ncbi:hypothetical protein V7798_07725 [Rhizobium laguerreae]
MAVGKLVISILAAGFAIAGDRAPLYAPLFEALLDLRELLLSLDQLFDPVELSHDCVVPGIELRCAGLVGICRDGVECFASVVDELATLLIEVLKGHAFLQ